MGTIKKHVLDGGEILLSYTQKSYEDILLETTLPESQTQVLIAKNQFVVFDPHRKFGLENRRGPWEANDGCYPILLEKSDARLLKHLLIQYGWSAEVDEHEEHLVRGKAYCFLQPKEESPQ